MARRSKHQIRRSGISGKSHQEQLEKHLTRRYRYVFRQSQVQGYKQIRGMPGEVPKIGLGGRSPATADWVVGDDLDNLFIIEAKESRTAPYTRAQQREYPRINANGGEIVHQEPKQNLVDGRTYDLNGRALKKPNTVTFYTSDRVALDNGMASLDELAGSRRGILNPEPSPYHMPPSSLEAGEAGSRATETRGLADAGSETTRATSRAGTTEPPMETRPGLSGAAAGEMIEPGSPGIRPTPLARGSGRAVQAAARSARMLVRSGAIAARAIARSVLYAASFIGVDVVLIPLDLWLTLRQMKFDKDMQEAIQKFLTVNYSNWEKSLLASNEEEIAGYFLQAWDRPSRLFLYLSPLIQIRSQNKTVHGKFMFDIKFDTEEPLHERAVSRLPVSKLEVFNPAHYSYFAEMRWSVPYPVLTPFDAFHAYMMVLAEILAASVQSAALRKPFSPARKRQLVDLVEHMSTIAGWLRMDHLAGFSGINPFSEEVARADRVQTIARIAKQIKTKVEPLAESLEQAGILNSDALILVWGSSPAVYQKLALQFSEAEAGGFAGYFRRLSYELSGIPPKALTYQRREGIHLQQPLFEFEKEKADFRGKLLRKISEHLPEEVRKEEAAKEFLSNAPQGTLILEETQ